MKTKEFVLCSPPYDLNSGGSIVLHYLCYLLNQLGETAYMFFNDKIWVRKWRHFEKTLFRNDLKINFIKEILRMRLWYIPRELEAILMV